MAVVRVHWRIAWWRTILTSLVSLCHVIRVFTLYIIILNFYYIHFTKSSYPTWANLLSCLLKIDRVTSCSGWSRKKNNTSQKVALFCFIIEPYVFSLGPQSAPFIIIIIIRVCIHSWKRNPSLDWSHRCLCLANLDHKGLICLVRWSLHLAFGRPCSLVQSTCNSWAPLCCFDGPTIISPFSYTLISNPENFFNPLLNWGIQFFVIGLY